MITTKIGLVAAGVAALTGAYSAPAQAWGWHGGHGGRVAYARPYVGVGYGVRAPYVAPAPYAYGAGYGYGAPVAYGADYGYGGGYGYGAPVVNVGWNRPVYGGYGHAGYGWGGGRGYGGAGYGGGRGWGGGGHFGGGHGRR